MELVTYHIAEVSALADDVIREWKLRRVLPLTLQIAFTGYVN